jgi:hypothetical protein
MISGSAATTFPIKGTSPKEKAVHSHRKEAMMDSSISFNQARIDEIKGEVTERRNLNPIDVATLLFEEVQELAKEKELRSFCDGLYTGVGVDGGSRTIPFSEVDIPDGMLIRSIADHRMKYGGNYSRRLDDMIWQWGVLAIGCDENDQPHWFWILVWDYPVTDGPRSVVRELSVEGLALLMTLTEDGRPNLPVMSMTHAYEGFRNKMWRYASLLQRRANHISERVQRSDLRKANIRTMIDGKRQN